MARQTHCCSQRPDPILSFSIVEFFHFHEYIVFSKEKTVRPSRTPGKITLFQVFYFILLLLDDLEAFIWNHYLENHDLAVTLYYLFSFDQSQIKMEYDYPILLFPTFTEVLRIPTLKHVLLKAVCKAETTVAEVMMVKDIVNPSNTMLTSLFLRLGLRLQESFDF